MGAHAGHAGRLRIAITRCQITTCKKGCSATVSPLLIKRRSVLGRGCPLWCPCLSLIGSFVMCSLLANTVASPPFFIFNFFLECNNRIKFCRSRGLNPEPRDPRNPKMKNVPHVTATATEHGCLTRAFCESCLGSNSAR